MAIGSPFTNQYPEWIWRWMKTNRRGKDVFDPFFRMFNATRIYDLALKSSPRYWTFIAASSVAFGWVYGRGFDVMWDRINRGKQYKDLPYTYPEEDE